MIICCTTLKQSTYSITAESEFDPRRQMERPNDAAKTNESFIDQWIKHFEIVLL